MHICSANSVSCSLRVGDRLPIPIDRARTWLVVLFTRSLGSIGGCEDPRLDLVGESDLRLHLHLHRKGGRSSKRARVESEPGSSESRCLTAVFEPIVDSQSSVEFDHKETLFHRATSTKCSHRLNSNKKRNCCCCRPRKRTLTSSAHTDRLNTGTVLITQRRAASCITVGLSNAATFLSRGSQPFRACAYCRRAPDDILFVHGNCLSDRWENAESHFSGQRGMKGPLARAIHLAHPNHMDHSICGILVDVMLRGSRIESTRSFKKRPRRHRGERL